MIRELDRKLAAFCRLVGCSSRRDRRRARIVAGIAATAFSISAAWIQPASSQESLAVDSPSERIVNGTPTGDYSAVGLLLSGSSPNGASMLCTGTLIGCKTFMTAAHCVCDGAGSDCQSPNDPDPGALLVFLPHVGFLPVSRVVVHPDYTFLSRFSQSDIALVELSVPASGIHPIAVADDPTPVGTGVTIVGYGRSGGNSKNVDYGIKRVGTVNTAMCNTSTLDGLICWNFFGPGSNTCNGDSGGPLLADFGAGEVVAGITSGGASVTCLPNDHSFDTDVGYFHDWIVANATETLGTASCGSGSQVGDPDNTSTSVTGSLAGCRLSSTHEVKLAEGSGQLRISMNAKDDGESDFNLLVKHGSPPTSSSFDCKQSGSGQFGFCQFSAPAGGRWYARVERVVGGGSYQVTYNDRDTQPPVCGNALAEPGEECDGSDDDACTGLCSGGCDCPAPVCGNGVQEDGEACDGAADSDCPGLCGPGCTCECLENDLAVKRAAVKHDRLTVKATIDNSGGEYTGFNPSDGFRLTLSDGASSISIELPPGDPGWEKSKCSQGRFKWKGSQDGLTLVRITDRTATRGTIELKARGKEVVGAAALQPVPLVVETHLDGTCTVGAAE